MSIDDINRVCEGTEPESEYEFIVKDLIVTLEKYGYRVIKENKEDK